VWWLFFITADIVSPSQISSRDVGNKLVNRFKQVLRLKINGRAYSGICRDGKVAFKANDSIHGKKKEREDSSTQDVPFHSLDWA